MLDLCAQMQNYDEQRRVSIGMTSRRCKREPSYVLPALLLEQSVTQSTHWQLECSCASERRVATLNLNWKTKCALLDGMSGAGRAREGGVPVMAATREADIGKA